MDHTVHIHLESMSGNSDTIWLHYDFGDTPAGVNQKATVTLSKAELTSLVKQSEVDYYAEQPGDDATGVANRLRALGARQYSLLDTERKVLSGFLSSTIGCWDVTVLAMSSEIKDARRLPWELLHDGETYLVNRPNPVVPVRVVGRHVGTETTLPRALNVLFMACAPVGAEYDLDYDAEESAIDRIAIEYDLPLVLEYEDTGSLEGLRRRLARNPERHFDVVHITGHAIHDHGRPVFVTEDAVGRPQFASAIELRKALHEARPRLVFLSGCRTAEPGRAGLAASLAEEIATTSSRTVIGWSRPIADHAATLATADFYHALMSGSSPASALAATHGRLLDEGQSQWHCLRMFTHGAPPPPFVTRVADMAEDILSLDRAAPKTPWGLVRVNIGKFVGRRRETQLLLRNLDPSRHSVTRGVVVHGLGGVGKTTLVSRALDLLTGKIAFVSVNTELTRDSLLTAMRRDTELANILGTANQDRNLAELLTEVLDQVHRPVVFIFDQFERNIPDATPRSRPRSAAGEALTAVIKAVLDSVRRHRVVVTSRYQPEARGVEQLADLPLAPLGDVHIRRKLERLQQLSHHRLDDSTMGEIRRYSGANTRLIDTLYRICQNGGAALSARHLANQLAEARGTFYAEDLLVTRLLERQHPGDIDLLHRVAPLQISFGTEVIARLAGPGSLLDATEVPEAAMLDAERRALRLASWHLLELEDDPQRGIVFRLPSVLEPLFREAEPDADRRSARALAAALASFDEVEDPSLLDREAIEEVLRLSLRSRTTDLVVRSASTLAAISDFQYRHAESAEICERALAVTRDPLLVATLGNAMAERGESSIARSLFTEAHGRLSELSDYGRAKVLSLLAFWTEFYEPDARADLASKALAFALAAGSKVAEGSSLRNLAVAEAQRGSFDEARRHFAEAAKLAHDMVGGDQFAALVEMDRATEIELRAGQVEAAHRSLTKLSAWYQQREQPAHLAATELRIAGCLRQLNRLPEARTTAIKAYGITKGLGLARLHVDVLEELAIVELALALASLQPAKQQVKLALRYTNECRQLAERTGWPALRRKGLTTEYNAYIQLGRFRQAAAIDHELKELSAELADTSSHRAERLVFAAENLVNRDHGAEAVTQAQQALGLLASAVNPVVEARARRVLVDYADQATMSADYLEPHLRRLLDLYREIDQSQLPLIRFWLGRMHLREDRTRDAIEELTAALHEYQDLEDRPMVAVVNETLAGIPTLTQESRQEHLRTAVNIRLADNDSTAVVTDLVAIGALQSPEHRITTLHAALLMAEASGDPTLRLAVLDEMVEAAPAAERAEYEIRATQARRLGEALHLVVGTKLSEMLDPDTGGLLLVDLATQRAALKKAEGIDLPFVRATDDPAIGPWEYVVYLWGAESERGNVKPRMLRRRLLPDIVSATESRQPASEAVVEAIMRVARAASERLRIPPRTETYPLGEAELERIDAAVRAN